MNENVCLKHDEGTTTVVQRRARYRMKAVWSIRALLINFAVASPLLFGYNPPALKTPDPDNSSAPRENYVPKIISQPKKQYVHGLSTSHRHFFL
jgi:hypothetical protein